VTLLPQHLRQPPPEHATWWGRFMLGAALVSWLVIFWAGLVVLT
jgi:hypothetical protein